MSKKEQKSGQEDWKKRVSGYAQGEGKVVHIIVDDIYLLCDKKRQLMPEEDKGIGSVSCAKCKRGTVYKNLIGPQQPKKEAAEKIDLSDHSDAEKAVATAHKDMEKDAAAKKKKQPPEKKKDTKKKAAGKPVPKAKMPPWKKGDQVIIDIKGRTRQAEVVSVGLERTTVMTTVRGGGRKMMLPNLIIKTPQPSKKKEKKQEQQQLPLNKPGEPENKEEPDKNQLLMLANMLSSIKGQFMAEMKTNFTYRIKHVAGDRVFFDGVKQGVISQSLLMLNNIEEIWDGKEVPNKDFLSKAREAFSEAHKLAGCDYPESLQKKADEKKEVDKKKKKSGDKPESKKTPTKLPRRRKKKDKKEAITKLPRRRQKKSKKEEAPAKLPRRRKKTETLFGKRAGTPIYTIASTMIERPVTKAYLLKLLEKIHGMDEKRAKGRFASSIRILTRRLGVVVQIIQMKREQDDIYYIPESDVNPEK